MAIDVMSGVATYSAPNTNASVGTSASVVTTAKPVVPVEKVDVADSSAEVAVKSEDVENNVSNTAEIPITEDKMKKAIDNINRSLQDKTCEFGYDEATNRVTIKIIDKETDEVIREIPPEKTLRMIAKAWELAGILVDEKL